MTEPVLKLSEIFASLQGEGVSVGVPCVFLRLALCNLRCSWCDTKYTWDFKAYRYDDEVTELTVAEVVAKVRGLAPNRLVITGGEPLLQQPALEALLAHLPDHFAEVETNGTFEPSQFLSRRVDQWNVSPKLANSGERPERRIDEAALGALLATGRAWLKLVVEEQDAGEALSLIERLSWPRDRVLFMPQAATRQELSSRALPIAELAQHHGVRFSSRLHVALWGGRRGV